MKKSKIVSAVLVALLTLGIIISSIVCTYVFHLNVKALWWSWILIIFILDIVFGLYIFYNSKRADESKVYWLIIIVLVPVVGCVLFMFFGWKTRSYFPESDNNHAKLLHAIFSAKKSIKIYSNTFYPSYDTFNALNFVSYKNVNVELLIASQETKAKQEYLEYKLEQFLDKRIKLYFTNLCAESSFIIIDDKYAYLCPKNFNFKYIYSDKKLVKLDDFEAQKDRYEHDKLRSSLYDYKNAKFSKSKRLKFAIINIFYSFL